MEKTSSSNVNTGMEENILEILDSSGVKVAQDIDDDRLTFLEAVRVAWVYPESGPAPTSKIFEAIFQILKKETSLELSMASYQLLTVLDQRFPRVYLCHSDNSSELVVNKEAWSPFATGSESANIERDALRGNTGDPVDSSALFLLTENLAQAVNDVDFQMSGPKTIGEMLLFQYLVSVLERDFLPRNTLYKDTMQWVYVRESLLNMLLGSRRINYKSLIKHCLSIITKVSSAGSGVPNLENVAHSSGETQHNNGIAFFELGKGTCVAVQNLLMLTMELDVTKKHADIQGSTSRVDAVRTPLVEVIVDELTYNEDFLSPVLQALSEPKWKLEVVLKYFGKYIAKPSVRTRRASNVSEDVTLEDVLRCFSSEASTRGIIRKIGLEVVQVLLAHAFQAYISLENYVKYDAGLNRDGGTGSSILKICKETIFAYQNIGKANKDIEMMPLGREAMFTAATILASN